MNRVHGDRWGSFYGEVFQQICRRCTLRARNHPFSGPPWSKVVTYSGALTIMASLGVWGLTRPATSSASTTSTCATSDLAVWLNTSASGTAGSDYYIVNFTNLSSHSCTLGGYPGVSSVTLSTSQLGSAAARDTAHAAKLFTLVSAQGASGLAAANTKNSATAILQITDVGNFSASKCGPVTAAGLRVYPPGQTSAKVIPYPFVACAKSGPKYLHVEAIQKYVATQ